MAVQINLRKLHPIQLVQRALFCQSIKEIGVEKILKLEKKHQVFIMQVGSPEEGYDHELDWEFILFEATIHQMDQFLLNFVARPKEEIKLEMENGSSIILEGNVAEAGQSFIPLKLD